jgi:hypothetical protein
MWHEIWQDLRSVAGHVAFFSFQAELKDPRDFKKALFFEQGIAVTFYMIISVVIYYYVGPLVASPALGSASPLVTKIAFGIALPTIIMAGVVNGSVACKYIYIRIWAGTNVVHQNSRKAVGSWVAICAVAWLISWILAEAIPNFNLFLGLIGALFGSLYSCECSVIVHEGCRMNSLTFTDALPPCLWLYQHKCNWFSTKRKTTLTIVNFTVVILGVTIVRVPSTGELSYVEITNVFSVRTRYVGIRLRASSWCWWQGLLVCE